MKRLDRTPSKKTRARLKAGLTILAAALYGFIGGTYLSDGVFWMILCFSCLLGWRLSGPWHHRSGYWDGMGRAIQLYQQANNTAVEQHRPMEVYDFPDLMAEDAQKQLFEWEMGRRRLLKARYIAWIDKRRKAGHPPWWQVWTYWFSTGPVVPTEEPANAGESDD